MNKESSVSGVATFVMAPDLPLMLGTSARYRMEKSR